MTLKGAVIQQYK